MSPVHPEAPAIATLPAAFSKAVPESLDDLQQIEDHVQSLIPAAMASTVALRIGPAQGSGVIVSPDGDILTAAHVSGAPGRRIEITLPDGTHAFGRTMGRSRSLDAGLVKLDATDHPWPYSPMAKQGELQHGDWCLVTGHPGGYQQGRPPVVRLGRIVAATNHLVQTDCELVGGDSGGPMFDMHGQVIGINSRIGEDTSLNLHVPVSLYLNNWERLLASETFGEAFLGVAGEPAERGVRLTRVFTDQPASASGIQVDDVLMTFQGVPVRSLEQLQELVGAEQPGGTVQIQLLRGGRTLEIAVRLGSRAG